MFRLSRPAIIRLMSDAHKEHERGEACLYSVMNYNNIIKKNEIINLKYLTLLFLSTSSRCADFSNSLP